MKLTRFRVAGLIAILGCGAAWAASSRAQTGSPGRSSATAKPRVQQADPFHLKTAPSQTAGVVQVSSPVASYDHEKSSSQGEAARLPSTQFRELSVPNSARSSPGRKKQVVDLRDRIASNPYGAHEQTKSTNSQSQRSLEWVDATIPQQLFDQAQMTPRQLSSGEEPYTVPPPATPPLDIPNIDADRAPTQTQRVLIPRELAPPQTSPIEVSPSELSIHETQSIEPRADDEPQSQSLQLGQNAPLQQPVDSIRTDEQSDRNPSRSGSQEFNEQRVPGQTFTPSQVIPQWIYLDAGQGGVAADAKAMGDSAPTNPSSRIAEPKAGTNRSNVTEPIRQDNLTPKIPNPVTASPNNSRGAVSTDGTPSPATPSQVIPDWIYGQAGVQPPQDAVRPMPQTQTQQQQAIPVPSGISNSAPGNRPTQPQPANQAAPNAILGNEPNLVPAQPETNQDKTKADHTPRFALAASYPPESDPLSGQVGYCPSDFSDGTGPLGSTFDPHAAAHVYRGKFAITTQRPLVELWRPLYTGGVYAPAPTWFGVTNPMKPHFLVYGDLRTAGGANHNANGKSNVWGNVLNLDMDLQLTSTERVHAFVSPLNTGTTASGVSFNEQLDLIDGTNFNFNTLFFEGDAGALLGGARGTYPPFDLPFTFGLIPLIYQNGIWANDAMLGAAVALPARHSRALKWSNFDATLFWATDNVTSDAFPNQDSAADLFGTAWFIDAYEGHIEADYAFVNDNSGRNRGYHNISMAFTRRYFSKLSNSVRLIVNAGQSDLAPIDRTADGHLLLIENSFISAYPSTIVPYVNLFYGQGRPQSLARVGIAGGILTNTGINFETDGITGYPTLDPTGSNAFGFASGINMLGSQFSHQLVLEFAMLQAVGSRQLRNAAGDEYGVGVRYQKPLSHNLIFRTDHMAGFREDATNITGSRVELRWKF